jgi:translation initiation factor 6 (eIF-6)
MLDFNQRGLLIPETIIKSDMEEFKNEFSVKLNEGKREELFNQYQL